jgi:hypothetical protein
MACDFYEAVFWCKVNGTNILARATWEIGQSAGIKGVYRGVNGAGYNYPIMYHHEVQSEIKGLASIFVGRKTDKTLLAAGMMTHVNGNPGTLIDSDTKSVTFTVRPITTKLHIYAVNDSDTSFLTASGASDPSNDDNVSLTNTKGNNNEWAEHVSLGGVEYPYYKLPVNNPSNKVAAIYRFLTSYEYKYQLIRILGNANRAQVIKREPRFLAGGQYYYVQQAKIDTGTTVVIDFDYVDTEWGTYLTVNSGSAHYVFIDGIKFIFDTSNSRGGIFSFTFRIPVLNLAYPTSGDGIPYVTWYLQPGFGRDLYSLDDGKYGSGGCILMGYNADFGGDMIDIFTTGMPW